MVGLRIPMPPPTYLGNQKMNDGWLHIISQGIKIIFNKRNPMGKLIDKISHQDFGREAFFSIWLLLTQRANNNIFSGVRFVSHVLTRNYGIMRLQSRIMKSRTSSALSSGHCVPCMLFQGGSFQSKTKLKIISFQSRNKHKLSLE